MAEMPKLTARELAKLIAEEKDLRLQLALIEEFCKVYDRERGIDEPARKPEPPRPAAGKE